MSQENITALFYLSCISLIFVSIPLLIANIAVFVMIVGFFVEDEDDEDF